MRTARLILALTGSPLLLGGLLAGASAKPKRPPMRDGKQVAVATPSRSRKSSEKAVAHGTPSSHGKASSRALTHGATHHNANRKGTLRSGATHHAAATTPAYHDRLIPVPVARPLALPPTPPTGESYAAPAHPPAEGLQPNPQRTPPFVSPVTVPPDDSTAVPPPPENVPAGAATAPPFEQVARGHSALSYPAALRGFFAALQAHEAQPAAGTVRVMQWGDSHTAADMFSGEARAQMQARFGDGGVGYTYPGHPFAGYRILGSGRGESAGWTTLGTHFTQLGDTLLGLGGIAIETSREGSTASFDAPCRTLDVQYLARGGGGSFQLSEDGAPVQSISTEVSTVPSLPTGVDPASATGPGEDGLSVTRVGSTVGAERAGTFHLVCLPRSDGPTPSSPAHHFTLTTLDSAPVRLLGTVALQPGLTWEAMGINGAEAPLILKWNQGLFGQYLGTAAPQLIVLAYGTNEAAARYPEGTYEAVFARLIDTLHRDAPGASILVLGPGDRSLGSTFYTTVGRGRHKTRVAHHSYTPYSGTARIVSAQREVCRTHGCAFWDWQARQGGLGSMQRWVASGLGQPDHTHFTGTGYRTLADSLVADLLSAYDAYTKRATGF